MNNTPPFPVRYRLSRPYGPQLDTLGREIAAGTVMSDGDVSRRGHALIEATAKETFQKARKALAAMSSQEAAELAAATQSCLIQEAALAREYVQFSGAGSQIFTFQRRLIEMLMASDVDQIPASELRMPYSHLYIALREPLSVEDYAEGAATTAYVDGVYVRQKGDQLILLATTTTMGDSNFFLDHQNGIGGRVAITLDPSKTLAECLDTSLAAHIADGEAQLKRHWLEKSSGQGAWEQAVAQSVADEGQGGLEHLQLLVSTGILERRTRQLLTLVANALCYVTAYRDTGDSGWADGTPPEKVAALDRANSPKRKAQMERELAWGGFRRVVLFPEPATEPGPSHGHASPTAHWRRGHWRSQPFGERALGLRRLTWIRPCLVASANSVVLQGHDYDAGDLQSPPA